MSDKGDLYYYKIRGLMIPSQNVPKTINENINKYIDKIENYTSQLESSFNAQSLTDFISCIDLIQEMLRSVYARWLEADGNELQRAARNDRRDICRQLLKPFITNLISLSIEMQKAQNLANTTKAPVYSYRDTEKYVENANNISAINKLLTSGDYEKAKSMILEMQKNKDNKDHRLGALAQLLNAHQYNKAGELASSIYNEYNGRMKGISNSTAGLRKMVLAVDDRPEILASVTAALQAYYKVLGAPGGQAALKVMQQQPVDLFVLDIEMPGMDGFELVERIREIPQYAHTPIMFLTGNSSRENIKKSMQLDIIDFIVKPTYNENLLAKVGKYLC